MSDLISRSALIKELKDLADKNYDDKQSYFALIGAIGRVKDAPLAYDVEKVVAEAYNKGLNDAWELANKIADTLTTSERAEIFGYVVNGITVMDILRDFTPQEALAKLEDYEKEQNEIKVGDIIICYDKEGVVTKVDDNYFNIVYEDGSSDKISQIICKKKTGKHIDIQSVLKQIGGVE